MAGSTRSTATSPRGESRALANRSRDAAFFCYHSIAAEGPTLLSLHPDTFERQLAALRRRGFAGGSLTELARLAGGARPERPQAFLTFDDGYADNHDTALPLLRAYGFAATAFVLPPYVESGRAFDWPEVTVDAQRHPDVMRSMDWRMIEALAEAGIEIGSHTCSHPHLPEASDDLLAQELLDSRRRISDRLGRCDVLAYPFGEWDRRVEAAAAAAGYSFAFSLPFGAQRGATPLSVPRINIDHRDRGLRFTAKLQPVVRRLLLSPVKVHLRRARAVPRGLLSAIRAGGAR